MAKNLDKEGLSSIVENYDVFYIDLWGVVHNGITLHKEAVKTLEQITKSKKDYVLLTNAPRPNKTGKKFDVSNPKIKNPQTITKTLPACKQNRSKTHPTSVKVTPTVRSP